MKSVLITGAARGIGRATAELFWQHGWFVAAVDVDSKGVEQWAAEKGERAFAGTLDVTDTEQWGSVLQAFREAHAGPLDLLVNNAGILADGNFSEIPLAKQHAIIDVNIKGVMNGCYMAKPHMVSGSRVINMSSASALYGAPSLATYSASKFAVRSLTEGLRIEWARDGIAVCDIMPLFVSTAMVRDMTQVEATKNIGVNLTAEQVAKTVYKAATATTPSVHYPVGRQTHLLKLAMRLFPDTVLSTVTAKLSGH